MKIHGEPLISRNALSQITKNNNIQFPEYMEKIHEDINLYQQY